MSSSRTTYSSNRNTAATATPYCKVCYDAGKPKSEYTSHFVKDQPGPNGKVVCPTLLNQACRICHKTGHTSSYCPEYKSRRDYRDEQQPRREEEPRHRREERYIPREEQPRHNNKSYYDDLREDTERREREIRQRDEEYNRQQDRRYKPWLEAALKKQEPEEEEQQQRRRREPYAHPHGPRPRLTLESGSLCASKHATGVAEPEPALPSVDVRKVELNHASKWGDEDAEEPFVYNPEQMSREFLQDAVMSCLTTEREHEFIAACDDQTQMPFECGQ